VKTPREILKTFWGYDDFKPQQEVIINSVLDANNTVALLPTGGGKSVCFQIPSLIMEGICIVVSPLVALISDQLNSLKDKGIKALALSGGISENELIDLLDNALYGNYKFLYLSPERLQQELVQNAIKRMQVNIFAIDEAHCISQWGNDFRPAYKNLSVLKSLQPNTPIIALTATATESVITDIIAELQLESPKIFKTSFSRPNISYQVKEVSDKYRIVEKILSKSNGNSIVYIRNRRQSEQISYRLNNLGIPSDFYHGGLTNKQKQDKLEAWKNEKVPVMIATNAFGMGIDHDQVRNVIHWQLPDSLESYYQEVGRAGRDGKEAKAILLYDKQDIQFLKKQFIDQQPTLKSCKDLYKRLNNYFQIPYGEGAFTEHSFSLASFCKTYELRPYAILAHLQLLERLSIIQLSKQFGRKSKIQFLVPSSELLDRFEEKIEFNIIGKTLLRMYSGLQESAKEVDLDWMSKKSGLETQKIIPILQKMEQEGLLSLQIFNTDASLTFLIPREDDRSINPHIETIKRNQKRRKDQVQAIIQYVTNSSYCRENQILHYFGEIIDEPCGRCSVCLGVERLIYGKVEKDLLEKIETLLLEETLDSRALCEHLEMYSEESILKALQWLLDRNIIQTNAINQYYKLK